MAAAEEVEEGEVEEVEVEVEVDDNKFWRISVKMDFVAPWVVYIPLTRLT